MPEEFSRTTARKRITLPTGGEVNVPVITKISFIDPYQQYQEFEHSINNSAEGDRTVHVDQVHPVTEGVSDDALSLPVERIEEWPSTDQYDRNQETRLQLDNITGSDQKPPSFITHLKTHVVRYRNEDDENIWIDSELIDSFAFIDPFDRYQEKVYTLLHPPGEFDAQGHEIIIADANDPNIADSDNGIDPPWRTDPFQNIVNWNGQTVGITWIYTGAYTYLFLPGAGTGGPKTFTHPDETVVDGSCAQTLVWTLTSAPDVQTGWSLTGAPTVPNQTYTDWTNFVGPWILSAPNAPSVPGVLPGYQIFTGGSIASPSGPLTATAETRGISITNLGEGYYGLAASSDGLFGHGYSDANLNPQFGASDVIGNFTVTVAGLSLQIDSAMWTWYKTDIVFLPRNFISSGEAGTGDGQPVVIVSAFFKP